MINSLSLEARIIYVKTTVLYWMYGRILLNILALQYYIHFIRQTLDFPDSLFRRNPK